MRNLSILVLLILGACSKDSENPLAALDSNYAAGSPTSNTGVTDQDTTITDGINDDTTTDDGTTVLDGESDSVELCIDFDADVAGQAQVWIANNSSERFDFSNYFEGTPLFDIDDVDPSAEYCRDVSEVVNYRAGDELKLNADLDADPPWLVYGENDDEVHGDATLGGEACTTSSNGVGGDYICRE